MLRLDAMIIKTIPAIINGKDRICPMFISIPFSQDSCEFFTNSIKNLIVNTPNKNNPKIMPWFTDFVFLFIIRCQSHKHLIKLI